MYATSAPSMATATREKYQRMMNASVVHSRNPARPSDQWKNRRGVAACKLHLKKTKFEKPRDHISEGSRVETRLALSSYETRRFQAMKPGDCKLWVGLDSTCTAPHQVGRQLGARVRPSTKVEKLSAAYAERKQMDSSGATAA
jgi:hypothetical protein